MFEALLNVLGAGLSIWDHEKKHEFIKKQLRLKSEYHDALNQTPRDNARLDIVERDLKDLSQAFSSEIAASSKK